MSKEGKYRNNAGENEFLTPECSLNRHSWPYKNPGFQRGEWLFIIPTDASWSLRYTYVNGGIYWGSQWSSMSVESFGKWTMTRIGQKWCKLIFVLQANYYNSYIYTHIYICEHWNWYLWAFFLLMLSKILEEYFSDYTLQHYLKIIANCSERNMFLKSL